MDENIQIERSLLGEIFATMDHVLDYLRSRDLMNSKLHIGRVKWSPLTDRVMLARNVLSQILASNQTKMTLGPIETDLEKVIKGLHAELCKIGDPKDADKILKGMEDDLRKRYKPETLGVSLDEIAAREGGPNSKPPQNPEAENSK